MFDWTGFLDSRRIPYVTSGPNVSKGNIAIHCPFCGAADTSQHLSISLEGKGWSCWRKRGEHRGKSPVRLIAALLGCSFAQAADIAGVRTHITEDFQSRVQAALRPQEAIPPSKLLRMPKSFIPFDQGTVLIRPFRNHIVQTRRIPWDAFLILGQLFDLRYCTEGKFAGRIIFPIRYRDRLVAWTGRSIRKGETLRYRATDPEEDGGDNISDYILWYDELLKERANTIYVCEGPFDALKVWYLGQDHGIVSTCFFTSSPSARQIDRLYDVLARFRHRFLLLDQGTLSTAMRVQMQTTLGLVVRHLPSNIKDPGELQDFRFLLP
jgi:hypothetical protein